LSDAKTVGHSVELNVRGCVCVAMHYLQSRGAGQRKIENHAIHRIRITLLLPGSVRQHDQKTILIAVEGATASFTEMSDRVGRGPVTMSDQDAPDRDVKIKSERVYGCRLACSKKASHLKCIW